jgi:hypothetical protein
MRAVTVRAACSDIVVEVLIQKDVARIIVDQLGAGIRLRESTAKGHDFKR